MRRYDDTPTMQIRLQWSPNSFKGFGIALAFVSLVVVVSMCTHIEPPEQFIISQSTPVDLTFGPGDGTGARKGNLTQEGIAQKGRESQNPLEDARRAASADHAKPISDPTQSARLIPVKDLGNDRNKNKLEGNADESVGSQNGKDNGTGIGWAGTGAGKGLGYGDIDWGGGGNRIVLNKALPKFPPGTLNTEVKLRFRVRPDGTVSWVIPMRKGGNPAVDQAAISAMYQWRFNPLSNDVDMEGTITFVFRNS